MSKHGRFFKSFSAMLVSLCLVVPNNVITFADDEGTSVPSDEIQEPETQETVSENDLGEENQEAEPAEEEPAEELTEETEEEVISEVVEEPAEEEEPVYAGPEETAEKEYESIPETPAEQEEPAEAPEEETVEEEPSLPVPVERVYTYNGNDIQVTATLQDAAAVPDDAELVVTPVVSHDSVYDYDAYMDALNKANPDKEYTEENTLLYDIAFMWEEKDESGEPTGRTVEYEPEEGKVNLSISFIRDQISEVLGAENASDVEVLHLPLTDSVKENIDATKEAGSLSASDIRVENVTSKDVSVENNAVSFDTDSLSLFAFSVDFHYNGKDYSIPGETQILLSDLIEKMHITADGSDDGELVNILDVASVTFSSSHLVDVTEVSGLISYTSSEGPVENYDVGEKDFLLSSKEAFSTEEALTITLNDGTVITVGVTDAQDAYTFTVNLVSRDDMTQGVVPGEGDAKPISGNYFGRILMSDEDGKYIGWGVGTLNMTGENPHIASISTIRLLDSETTVDDDGNEVITYTDNGQTMSYADAVAAGYTVATKGDARVCHGNYPNNYNDAMALDVSDPDGYTFASHDKTESESVVTLRTANDSQYFVRIKSDTPLTLPTSGALYAVVKVDHSSGVYTYGIAEVKADNSTDGGLTFNMPIDTWYLASGQVAANEVIYGHEKEVSVALYMSETSGITSPIQNYTLNSALKEISVGGSVNNCIVEQYPAVPKDYVPSGDKPMREIINDEENKKTERHDIVYLTTCKDKLSDYSLEYLLNGYNAITICPNDESKTHTYNGHTYSDGDVYLVTHMMGGVLIRGDLIAGGGSGVADSTEITKPSFVGGSTPKVGEAGFLGVNTRDAGTDKSAPVFYVGDSNEVGGNNYVNGPTGNDGYNHNGETVVNNDYIDWDRLVSSVIGTSNALAETTGTVIDVTNDWMEVEVQAGQVYTINNPNNFEHLKIKIVGDVSSEGAKATIFNNTSSGEVTVPQITSINGESIKFMEDFPAGVAIVFNYPNATKATISNDMTPEVGHVIAPNADMVIKGGNYNGCMVVNSLYTEGEGHLWPYRGGSLIVTTAGFVVGKTVNGETPTEDQVYTFNLDEFKDGAWSNIQQKQNDKREITFDEVKLNTTGTFWMRMTEDESSVTTGKADDTWYVVKVVVTSHEEGSDTVLDQVSTAYKVTNKEALIQNGEINENALEIVGSGDVEGITFINEEYGSLKIKKNVTENGSAPSSDEAKAVLAGTYTFTLYTDADCTEPYQVDGQNVTVSLTIPADGSSVTSDEVKNLPAGDYWIKETDPEDKRIKPVENPVNVTVVAGAEGDEAVVAEFTNNFETTELTVEKMWANADGSKTWPAGVEVTLQLTADGTPVTGKTVKLNADKTSDKFTSLPKYKADGTTEIVYGVDEVNVAGYDSVVGALENGKITVTNTQETTELTVEKMWANADGSKTWPAGVEVTLQLTADGTPVTGKTVKLNADKTSDKFTSLPKYKADGTTEIVYGVDEVNVAGYDSVVGALENGKITVTNTQETTDVTVEKMWVNADGTSNWPKDVKVTVQLTADGNDVSGKTAELSSTKTSHTFEDLPKYQADGTTEIIYGVQEVKVAGYTSVAAAIENGKITVTNTEDTGSLKVKKVVTGNDAKGTYEIAVKNAEGHYFDVDGKDKGTTAFYVSFAKDAEQTWTNLIPGDYTVEEKDAAVEGYTWTVSGNENVTVEKDQITSQTVVNTYVKGSSAVVQATKLFNGETWPQNGFEFTLEAGTNDAGVTTPMPASDKAYATKGTPVAVFGEIKFSKAGVYNYTITETDGGEEYITYDTAPHAVVITVTEDPETHELSTNVKYDGAAALEVSNTYSAEGKAKIEVGKKLTGKELKDDDFSFTLEAVTEGAKLPQTTIVTNKAGKASFDEITYVLSDAGKEYVYKISETIDTSKTPGVTQNTSDPNPTNIFAKVTVGADQGNGTLAESTVEYFKDEACSIPLETAEFVNKYYAEGEIPLSGVKKLDGRKFVESDTWTFAITANNGGPLPVDSQGNEVTSITIHPATGESTYSFAVGTFKYTLEDLSNGDGTYATTKVFEYTVTESGTIAGVKNDPKTTRVIKLQVTDNGRGQLNVTPAEGNEGIEYTNTYSEEGDVQFTAKKTFNVKDTDKEFTFILTDQDGKTETKTVTGSGTVTFSKISLEAGKEYTYTLEEDIPAAATADNSYTADGITYDPTVYTLTFKAVSDGQGTIKTDPEVLVFTSADGKKTAAEPEFANEYNASGNAELKATKSISYWGTAEKFTFTLTSVEGAPMPEEAGESTTLSKDATKDNPEAVFGTITYTAPGTYKYTIQEEPGDADGVTYDTTAKNVTVTVEDKKHNGELDVTVKYGEEDSLTITNTYTSTKAKLEATKSFNDWGKAESFTFNLAAVTEGAPMPENTTATATQNAPKATFDEIEFKKAGTYEYTITEVNDGVDGVKYDTEPHKVVVTVSKDANNKLSADVKYDDAESLTITNTYASTKATIEATKDFNDWGKAQSFTFKLAAVTEGAPMPSNTTATATKDATLASFGEIEYEKTGTYEYTITEVNDGVDGVTYDTTPHKVVVTVSKDANNKLSADVKYDDAESLTITNTYASTKATIEATKDFNDWGKAESFTFNLAAVTENAPMPKDDEGNVVTEATATKDATLASFGEIEYEKSGTYEYTITEVNDHVDGVTYDTTPHRVVVTVSKADDATNKLSASVKYDGADSLTITNTYASVKATIQATKQFNDWGQAEKFTFNLAAVDDAPLPANTSVDATKDNPTAVFGEVEYEHTGTYEYTITEVNDGIEGVTYDTKEHKVVVTVSKDENNTLSADVKYDGENALVITNTFASGNVTLQATKAFEDWGKAESFTFNLAAVTKDAPMPENTTAVATENEPLAVFGSVTYKTVGTYEYTITEVNDKVDGVTYDTTPHKVVVTVTRDENDKTKLIAVAKYDDKDSLIITNTFTSLKVDLEVTKAFEDWGKADSFEFTLADGDNDAGVKTPMPEKDSGTATKDNPTVTFADIVFEKAGTYHYTITETNDGVDGVTYDTTPHEVVVKVTKADDDTNALSAEVTYDDAASLIITNTYASTKAKIEATKEFNDWGKAESFTFNLAAVTKDAPMPEQTTATATKNAPLASFGEIEYEKSGTYKYTITEVNDGVDGVTYDTDVHEVIVEVTKADDATNALSATVTYDGAESLTITNTYASTNATIEATKEFNDWGKAESFTFNLAAVTKDAPMPANTTATATEKTPTAVFGEIEYEKSGTYEYTITEVDDGVDGVKYDTTAHKVVVTVTKEDGTNALSADVKYDGASSLTITNTYTSTNATIEATKEFNDWGQAQSFTFNLAAVTKDAPMPEQTTATATEKAPTAVFGEIEYEKSGKYEYTITEVDDGIGGVTYDTTEHKVVVDVTKGTDNQLTANVTYDGGKSLIITNTFTSVKAPVEVTKNFNSWGKADSFTFNLAAVDDAPMPANTTAVATKDAPKAVFGEIEFKTVGTYKYTITEVNDGVDGVSYDVKPHEVVIEVTKGEKNALSAEVTYDGEKSLAVTNEYKSVKDHFEVTKEYEHWLDADTFTFELEAVDGAPMPKETTATATKEEPTAVFGDIEFEKTGTYEYIIREVMPEEATEENNYTVKGITYDPEPHTVTVTVSKADDETNALSTEVDYEGSESLTITNTYDAKGTGQLEANKVLIGRDWLDGETFTFKLESEDGPLPEDVMALAESQDEPAVFDEIEYGMNDVGKTYTYTITEVIPENAEEVADGIWVLDGITYDSTDHKATVSISDNNDGTLKVTIEYDTGETPIFTNTYAAEGEAPFSVTKALEGREWNDDDQFEFTIAAVTEGAPLPEETTAYATKDAKVAQFGNAKYTEAGVYEYTITETKGDIPFITYDTEPKKVTVTVTDENYDGKLTTVVTYEGKSSLTVTNTYGELKFNKYTDEGKTLSGAELTLYEAGSNKAIVTWTTDGKEKDLIDYLEAGKSYVIKETKVPENYMPAEDVKFSTDAEGKITGITLQQDNNGVYHIIDAQFRVEVKKTDEQGRMIEGAVLAVKDSNGKIVDKWETNGGVHVVKGLTAGETYTLTELTAPRGYSKAPDQTFKAGKNGEANVTTLIMVDKKLKSPDTSDHSGTAGWGISMGASLLMALWALLMRRRAA